MVDIDSGYSNNDLVRGVNRDHEASSTPTMVASAGRRPPQLAPPQLMHPGAGTWTRRQYLEA